MYLAITGRQQEISLAELESLFGATTITTLNHESVLVEHDGVARQFPRLGSTVSVARVHGKIASELSTIAKHLDYGELLKDHDRKKISLGLSIYGKKVSRTQHQQLLGAISTNLKKLGKTVRELRNNTQRLSSAQVFHNRLDDTRKNCELICCFDQVSKQWVVGQTVGVQNITAYRVRDRERPRRDTFVGMLPPKLAQTLINLSEISEPDGQTLLDPFCGTGVILQEAALMGFEVYGTDVSQKMIDYSKENLTWLKTPQLFRPKLEQGDAQTHAWGNPIDAVVSEMYLGAPLSSTPTDGERKQLQEENRQLLLNFLKNIHPQLKPETPLVLAIPAWRRGNKFEPAITFDDLKELTYNPVEFKHVDSQQLIYAREDQIVGRKIIVLHRK